VGVERLEISQNQRNFVDGKCLCDPDKWFVGHRDVIYSLRHFGDWVFQQPRLLAKIVCRAFVIQSWITGCQPFFNIDTPTASKAKRGGAIPTTVKTW
jgi:hypothetical protein